jgi:hypothetical protein
MKGGNPKGLNGTSDEDSDEDFDENEEEEFEEESEDEYGDERDDFNIDVTTMKEANEDNWRFKLSRKRKVELYENDDDIDAVKSWIRANTEKFSIRIDAWWNSFNHDHNYGSFEKCLDEVMYCYMEKEFFRYIGLVDSLKDWRKEKSASYEIISYMNRRFQKEVLAGYKSCNDDPGILAVPKNPVLEAWKSFSIISMEVYYFGFGNEETWLNFVDI